MVEFARDCDVLLHMCHYISGTLKPPMDVGNLDSTTGHMELARIGRDSGAKTVVLTHITGSMDAPGIRERIIGEMATIYKGNLYFGEDLLEVPLHGPRSRRLD
jgi:ribonuclease BN (tRNA processing enzyme)